MLKAKIEVLDRCKPIVFSVSAHHSSLLRVHRFFSNTPEIDELLRAQVPHSTIFSLYPMDLDEYARSLQELGQIEALFDELCDVLESGESSVSPTIWAFLNNQIPVNRKMSEFFVACQPLVPILAKRQQDTGRIYDELQLTRTFFLTMYSLWHWNELPVMKSVPKFQQGQLVSYLSALATFCERASTGC